jgi:hypothetical protein
MNRSDCMPVSCPLYPSTADILSRLGNVGSVPILLQKSVEGCVEQ